jgi:hypothetical protein
VRRAIRPTIAVLAIASAGLGGFAIGHAVGDGESGGPRAAVAEALAAGAEEGADQGYAQAFERARDRAYRTGYDAAYRAAYAVVFREAGVGNPVHIEIQRGPVDRSEPAASGGGLSGSRPEDLPGGTD